MGAASSVGASKAHGHIIIGSDESRTPHDDNVSDAASDFDACARILASKYHNSRLRVGGSLLLEDGEYVAMPDAISTPSIDSRIPSPSSAVLEKGSSKVSIPRVGSLSRSFSPPLPRAERKRLSQPIHPCTFACAVDGAGAKPRDNSAPVAVLSASLATKGLEGDARRRNTSIAGPMRSPENVEDAKTGEDAELPFSQEQQSLFVQRDEMVGLARDLGYAITPIQATAMFDMLDTQGHGRIAKDELLKHLLPLLQRDDRSTSSGKGYLGRRESEHKPPRRPRPSSRPPATIPPPRPAGEPPPRPVGEPPPNAKRRVTLPVFKVGSGERPANMTTSYSNASSALCARPAKFWLARPIGGGDDMIHSFPPVEDVGCETWSEKGGLGQDVKGPDDRQDGGERVHRPSSKGKQHSGVTTARGSGDWERIAISERVAGLKATDETIKNNHGINNSNHLDEWGRRGARNATTTTTSTGEESATNNNSDGCANDSANNSKISRGGESIFAEPWAQGSMAPIQGEGQERPAMRRCSVTAAVVMPVPSSGDHTLGGKEVTEWTTTDVLMWLKTLPRGLGAFAEAEAFLNGSVDGKRLATLTLSDLKRKEFHHAKFKAKVPTALWVEIKKVQPSADIVAVPMSSRFSTGESIIDEAARTTLCTVTRFVDQGAFGEVYQVVWKGVGTDWGSTMAMKTVRLADISSDKRDEYRVLLVEEILTAVRVKPHPNVVNVRFAHIMGFCSEGEEYFCFEDFVTGRNLGDLVVEGEGGLYDGTTAEVQGRLLSYSIQLARGLGHIHRCGVLHQDIKSANIMVSKDGLMLITDFGFATVGHFGPPPPPTTTTTTTASSTAEPEPTIYPDETMKTTATRKADKEDPARPETATEEEVGRGLVVTPLKTCDNHQRHPSNIDNRGPSGSRTILAASGAHDDARSNQVTDAGVSVSKGNSISRNVINTPVCGAQPDDNRRGDTAKHSSRGQHHDTSNNGVRSQLFEGVKGAYSNEGFPNETDIGGEYKEKVRTAKGKDRDEGGRLGATPPSRDRVLFGTLKGFTPRYQSPEICAIMDEKAKAASLASLPLSRNGCHSQSVASQPNSASTMLVTHRSDMWAAGVVILEMYVGGLAALRAGRGENAHTLLETLIQNSDRNSDNQQGIWIEDDRGSAALMPECCGTTNDTPGGGVEVGRNTGEHDSRGDGKARQKGECFRVAMPGDVRELLREIFKRDERERPMSVQDIAARLSRTLRGMLEEGGAVVPCPTAAAPSPLSLCEELPPYIEVEENHGKVGRLHMWLGKALFLKGEDRRGQALEEYREGVRVLEQSNADRGSPSMALFHWYLGEALLEVGEINEALPHLTEAVLIDPDNAKYRYTRGLAKRVNGDEAGAREDLREAAFLDEEDAENRYQLRVQRNSSEQRRVDKQQRDSVEANDNKEVVPQGAPHSEDKPDEADSTSSGKDSLANFKPPNSRSQALEAVAASPTRIYGLRGLDEYRTGKGGDVGGFRGGGGGDGTDAVGGKNTNRVGNSSEVRHFSVGDKICCGRSASTPVKPFKPMRCYSSRVDRHVDGSGTFVIDGLLAVGQASVHFCGEAYTATALRRDTETENDNDATNRQAYNIVHIPFEPGNKDRPSTSTTRTPTSIPTSFGEKNRAQPAATNGTTHVNRAASDSYSSREAGRKYSSSDYVHGRPSRKGFVSASSRSRSPVGSPHNLETDFLATLKTIARSAMVGFHSGLAGVMRDLTWTNGGITLVVDAVPSGCCTLRESLSGRLYQGTGIGRREGKQGSGATGAAGVVDRMLNLARQIAAAISRCHQTGVLLQDITPDEVLVTPRWEALLRPNYAHAREGYAWTTVSVRETAVREVRQQRQRLHGSSLGLDSEPLTALFSDTISPNYQSPEIAQIRRENERLPRVSGRAFRRSEPLLSSSPPASPSTSRESRLEISPTSTPPLSSSDTTHETPAINTSRSSRAKTGSDEDKGAAGLDTWERTRRVDDGRGTDIGRDTNDPSRVVSPLRKKHSIGGVGGEDSGASDLVGGDGDGIPTVSPRTSDIWAWALIVLQMFSDEAWAPGSGQAGLTTLESLLLRKRGVDTWTTDDVVSWLADVGLWSEGTERQMRAFKIAGPQLLVPSCRRDIVEKLGLFIMDCELAHKFWENITGGLQRWAMPPRLAQILRRCLADSPDDRYSTMEEMCELLRGVTADSDGANDDKNSAVLATARSRADGGEDKTANSLRAGMILNDIGVCLHGKGLHEEAERHYKMALLATEDIPEPYYNLGLLYAAPAFDKFKDAQQAFETAASLIGDGDPRRGVCVEHARAAERKSNYHQSQEVMQALSGKYKRVSLKGPRGSTIDAGGGDIKVQSSARVGQP